MVALAHPGHGGAVLIGILIAYSAIWTLYAVVAKSTQGIHADMGEFVAWSWALDWGTPKHPPLLPAVVRLWFSVFPLTDWAFYLLAVLCSAVAIYFTWLLSGFWLRGIKRAVVPFLLMLIPFYNFLALKLDHNVFLIPLWAITTYTFIKAYETRSIPWSVIAGICAGLAVLAKYWSFFLLLGLGTAALIDTRRLQYLKSWSPWIITAVSLALFLPHLVWLDAHHYPTYVSAQYRTANSTVHLITGLLKYFSGSFPYLAAPAILLVMLVRPSRRDLVDILLPREAERRFAAVMFWVPIVAPVPFAIATWAHLSGLWTMSGFSLIGVLLLSPPAIHLTRRSVAVIASAALIVSAAALAASPLVAIAKLRTGIPSDAAYTYPLAGEVQKLWDKATNKPLAFVEGDYNLVHPVTFYLRNKSLPIAFFARAKPSWDTDDVLDKHGAAFVCPKSNESCRSEIERIRAGRAVAEHAEVVVQSHGYGFTSEPRSFIVEIVPPRDEKGK